MQMSDTQLQTHYFAQVDKNKNIIGFLGTSDGNLVAQTIEISREESMKLGILFIGYDIKVETRRNKKRPYIVHKFLGTPNEKNYKIISECDRLSETNRQNLCNLISPNHRIEVPVTYAGKSTGAVFAIVSLLLTGTLHLYRKWKRQKQKEMNLKKQKRMLMKPMGNYEKKPPVSKKIASETV